MVALKKLSVFVLIMGWGFLLKIIMEVSPLFLGVGVLLLSFLVSFLAAIHSTWFGLVLGLVYLGGVLVLFAYFLLFAPRAEVSLKEAGLFLLKFTLLVVLLGQLSVAVALLGVYESGVKEIYVLFLLLQDNWEAMVFLLMILFYIMVVVVKILTPNGSAMRKFE